ncbi:Cysteine dioxygenase type I [hydrothermal vent metagenome]|uniref:Cysteine dioxygenase type I n=1 Tax=hydrothermal vent metagenome TaxID=652676 RepID=A0A1W1BL05_9ZZZZ
MSLKIEHFENLQYESIVSKINDLLVIGSYEKAINEFESIKDKLDLDSLPIVKNGYSRTIISIKDNYWMSLLRWDSNITTAIHGHPDLAFVCVLAGSIKNIAYQNNPLKEVDSKDYQVGEFFYAKGPKGKFDNAIHQLVIKKPSLTLHFYSDDARKGILFSEDELID